MSKQGTDQSGASASARKTWTRNRVECESFKKKVARLILKSVHSLRSHDRRRKWLEAYEPGWFARFDSEDVHRLISEPFLDEEGVHALLAGWLEDFSCLFAPPGMWEGRTPRDSEGQLRSSLAALFCAGKDLEALEQRYSLRGMRGSFALELDDDRIELANYYRKCLALEGIVINGFISAMMHEVSDPDRPRVELRADGDFNLNPEDLRKELESQPDGPEEVLYGVSLYRQLSSLSPQLKRAWYLNRVWLIKKGAAGLILKELYDPSTYELAIAHEWFDPMYLDLRDDVNTYQLISEPFLNEDGLGRLLKKYAPSARPARDELRSSLASLFCTNWGYDGLLHRVHQKDFACLDAEGRRLNLWQAFKQCANQEHLILPALLDATMKEFCYPAPISLDDLQAIAGLYLESDFLLDEQEAGQEPEEATRRPLEPEPDDSARAFEQSADPKPEEFAQPSSDSQKAVSGRRHAFVDPLLKNKGWSQEEWALNSLGEKSPQVAKSTITNYLGAKTKVRPSTLKRLADALGCTPADLDIN